MVASRGRRSSLEQERSRRSRDALIEAAAELLADDDLASVKIEDICRTAGVSKGLFYFYFGSKEELVVELLADDARAVAAEVDRGIAAERSVGDVLDAAVTTMSRRAQRRPRHVLASGAAEALADPAVTDPGSSPLAAAFVALADHGHQLGELDPEVDPRELAALLTVGLLRAQLEWAMSERRQPSLVRRLTSRAELVLHGAWAR